MTHAALSPGLRIAAYDDGEALWRDLINAWRSQPRSRLVVGSALRRQRLLTDQVAQHGTVLGGSIDSLERLWREVARQCGVPEPTDDVALTAWVKQLLHEDGIPAPLERVAARPRDLARLVRYLKQVDDSIGDSYTPSNRIEEGIQQVRARLQQLGVISRARFRALTADAASEHALDRPVLIAPPGTTSPVLGRFLAAVGRSVPVSLFMPTRPQDLPLALADLGLDDSTAVEEHFTNPLLRPRLRLVAADDEAEAAMEEVAGLIEQGHKPSQVMVVTPDRDAGEAVLAAARARGVPTVAGWGAALHDSLVGSLLERIAEIDPLDEPEAIDDQQRALAEHPDAAFLGASLADIQRSQAIVAATGSPFEQARYLHQLGLQLANGLVDRLHLGPTAIGPQMQQTFLWLDALRNQLNTIAHLQDQGLTPPDTLTILREAVAVPRPRGDADGVAVVTPRLAPALGCLCVVMTGLSAGTLPRPPATTPFSSAELLRKHPELAQRDEHPDLSAVVATASAHITMVRSAQSPEGVELDPSAWMNELAEEAAAEPGAGGVPKAERSTRGGTATRRRLQAQARAHATTNGAVAAAIEQLARHRDSGTLPSDLLGTRQSVTTLETYLRCPLGWLMGRYVSPWEPGGPSRHMGNVADDAMSAALRLGSGPVVAKAGIEDRVRAARESMHANVWYPHIPRSERADLEEWTVRAVRKYFDPEYMNSIAPGWRPVDDQTWLEMHIDDVRVTGQADRIDVTNEGLVVIDWKLQRAISLPAREVRGRELQRGLYPLMARNYDRGGVQLPADVFGFMYVSLVHGDHNGSFVGTAGGGGAVDTDWPNDCRQAQDNAARAIAGIRAGNVWEIGENCTVSYCGHHFLSNTAVVRG